MPTEVRFDDYVKYHIREMIQHDAMSLGQAEASARMKDRLRGFQEQMNTFPQCGRDFDLLSGLELKILTLRELNYVYSLFHDGKRFVVELYVVHHQKTSLQNVLESRAMFDATKPI